MKRFGLKGAGSEYSPVIRCCENCKRSFGLYERIYFVNSWVTVFVWRWFVFL